MPVGSPGMEMGDRQDAYQVVGLTRSGQASVLTEYLTLTKTPFPGETAFFPVAGREDHSARLSTFLCGDSSPSARNIDLIPRTAWRRRSRFSIRAKRT